MKRYFLIECIILSSLLVSCMGVDEISSDLFLKPSKYNFDIYNKENSLIYELKSDDFMSHNVIEGGYYLGKLQDLSDATRLEVEMVDMSYKTNLLLNGYSLDYYIAFYVTNGIDELRSDIKKVCVGPLSDYVMFSDLKIHSIDWKNGTVMLSFDCEIAEGVSITSSGVCYGLNNEPSITDDKYVEITYDSKKIILTDLSVSEDYYCRPFLRDGDNVVYGECISLNIKTDIIMDTLEPSELGTDFVVLNGCIEDSGGHEIIEKGFCWTEKALISHPTIDENYIVSDSSGDRFSATLTGLIPDTSYRIRAYAKTKKGDVVYASSTILVQTLKEQLLPELAPIKVYDISASSATMESNVQFDGNCEIVSCGFCLSESPDADINDIIITCDDSSLMRITIEGLEDGREYYVKAWAENIKGVAYSDEISFSTLLMTLPEMSEVSIDKIGRNSADVSSSVLFNGNADIIECGFCWSEFPEPTIETNKVCSSTNITNETWIYHDSLTDLPEATNIYVRSYAINARGVAYGDIASFITRKFDVDEWNGKTVAEKFSGGIGTESDPIIISSAAELKLLADNVNNAVANYENVYFKLVAEIDMNGNKWTPIGNYESPFCGNFDGNGAEISELYINSSDKYVGLFGCTRDATLKNIIVSGTITLYSDVAACGGIVGYVEDSFIDSCINKCDIYLASQSKGWQIVGGIAGKIYFDYTPVINCTNLGNIFAKNEDDEVGGIVGCVNYYGGKTGPVYNCVNLGTISDCGRIGGVIGFCYGRTPLGNLVNAGVISSDNAGGIMGGYSKSYQASGNNLFWSYNPGDNSGNQNMSGDCTYSFDDSYSFIIKNNQCLLAPDYTQDLVDKLNSWVYSNSTPEISLRQWKYEIKDGYAYPVLKY